MREYHNTRKSEVNDALIKMKMEQYYIAKKQSDLRMSLRSEDVYLLEQEKR